jgi:hypothetical protein
VARRRVTKEDECVSKCEKGLFGEWRGPVMTKESNSKASPWSRSAGGTGGTEGKVAGPGVKAKKKREKGGLRLRKKKGERGEDRFEYSGSGDLSAESLSCAGGA